MSGDTRQRTLGELDNAVRDLEKATSTAPGKMEGLLGKMEGILASAGLLMAALDVRILKAEVALFDITPILEKKFTLRGRGGMEEQERRARKHFEKAKAMKDEYDQSSLREGSRRRVELLDDAIKYFTKAERHQAKVNGILQTMTDTRRESYRLKNQMASLGESFETM